MLTSVYYGQNDLRIEERGRPEISDGEILIRVAFCGLCGTDIKKIEHGLAKPGVVLGHEVTGIVVESKHARFAVGTPIAVAHHVPCNTCHYCTHGNISMCAQFKSSNIDPGGFSEFVRIPKLHVENTTFALKNISLAEGIFLEPLACAVRNLDRHTLHAGDLAVVIGLGSMGILSAQALIARGVQVIGLDLSESRLKHAEQFGIIAMNANGGSINPSSINPPYPPLIKGEKEINSHTKGELKRETDPILEKIHALSDNRGADLVIVTAGPPSRLAHYLTWLRSGGSLNLFSSLYPETASDLPINDLYHREIQITSSYSASPDALKTAHALLESGAVQVSSMVNHVLPLSKIMTGIDDVLSGRVLKTLIDPRHFEKSEDPLWSTFALSSAMRGLEDDTHYSDADLKEKWK